MGFLDKVEAYMRENQMLAQGMRLVVGVSGGADSMCLLHVLDRLRGQYGLELVAVHVHHGIRGGEADRDKAFVEGECGRRGILCIPVYKNVPELARQKKVSEEEAGREARYQAFREAAREYKCGRIAMAHNQNDNAETFLFHAFRGSGIRGLRGIMPCRDEVIRPLLCVCREEIEEFLAEEGVGFCTDSTNFEMDYARNRIRHKILKTAVAEVNSRAVSHLSGLAGEIGKIMDLLEELSKTAYAGVRASEEAPALAATPPQSIRLSVSGLAALHPAILGEVLKMALGEAAGGSRDIERVHIDALKDLAAGATGRKICLPGGITAARSYDILELREEGQKDSFLEALSPSVEQPEPGPPFYTGNAVTPFYREIHGFPMECSMGGMHLCLWIRENEKNAPIPKNCYTKWFDYDKIGDILVLRTRRPGDFMVIHKDGRKKSLKSLFIDKKIPSMDRGRLLLLAAGSRILWVPGIRSEEGLYVDGNTKRILVAELKRKG